MCKIVAKFEKVSEKQYQESLGFNSSKFISYNEIKLPTRATHGSAGYDFYAPIDITLAKGEALVIPTFIRCKIEEGWVLLLLPKSGLGYKTHMRMANTVGVVDSDYYNSSNEGHISVKIINGNNTPLVIEKGMKLFQALLVPYGLAETEGEELKERDGGFGSTGK